MRRWKIALILAFVTALLHLIAAGVVLVIAPLGNDNALRAWFAAGAFATLTWMIAQGMTGAMRSLYARGDFDLLFASPISPLVVLASRALAVAVEGAASSLLLIAPLADMGALFGHRSWLAIYPALISSAFFGAGVGLAIALGLFLAFGPRRARLFSQVGATMVGASFVLSAQVVNLLPGRWRDAVLTAFAAPLQGSWLSRDGALYLPVRAAQGEAQALILWAIVSVAVFGLAVMCICPAPCFRGAAARHRPVGEGDVERDVVAEQLVVKAARCIDRRREAGLLCKRDAVQVDGGIDLHGIFDLLKLERDGLCLARFGRIRPDAARRARLASRDGGNKPGLSTTVRNSVLDDFFTLVTRISRITRPAIR